jgi:hypothetical protein
LRRTPALLLLSAALAQACSCDPLPKDALTSCELNQVVQAPVMTDILFVIDNSGSMTEETKNLKDNLNAFVAVLNGSAVATDFQIGITTVAVQGFDDLTIGLQGRMIGPVNVPGASPARTAGPILVGNSSTLLPSASNVNDMGDFAALVDAAFSSGETGKEQPFRAMKRALSSPLIDSGQQNERFLRPGARLAVIFLSDEDDCSETGANVANSNFKCHNDAGNGTDYKSLIDSIETYEGFLKGPIGGETRDVVLAAIVGVDEATKAPTCGYDAGMPNGWCCGSSLLNTATTCPVTAPVCASRSIVNAGLSGATYCCGEALAPYCKSSCTSAFDKADRFEELLSRFPATHQLSASICSNFAASLSQIAGLITSNSVPLQGEPADWRLLNVGLRLPDGSRLPCSLALDGTPEAQTADAVYTPGSGGKPPAVTFPDSGACYLDRGYSVGVEIDVICAG